MLHLLDLNAIFMMLAHSSKKQDKDCIQILQRMLYKATACNAFCPSVPVQHSRAIT